MTERLELRAGTPRAIAEVTVIPIERVRQFTHGSERFVWAYGSKEPVAVVVCGEGDPRAFEVDGREVPVADLERRVPGLHAVLTACRR